VALLLLGALSFPARVATDSEWARRLNDRSIEASGRSSPLWPPRNRMFLEQPKDAPTVIKFEWYEPAPAK